MKTASFTHVARNGGSNMADTLPRERQTTHYNQRQDGDSKSSERILYAIGGGALVLAGLARRDLAGIGLAVLGGGLAYRSLTGEWPLAGKPGIDADYSVRVETDVTINRPASEIFSLWRDFANLPRFMSHLESVTVLDGNRSHWVAKAPMGRTVEWDAEIINEEQDRLIAWRSVGEADVKSAGSVRFESAPGNHGTEVRVKIEYMPPGGAAGAMVAKIFQEEPGQQVKDDLRRLKQIMEAGEDATTEGWPLGG
jgi:uncharacterized membrane protein